MLQVEEMVSVKNFMSCVRNFNFVLQTVKTQYKFFTQSVPLDWFSFKQIKLKTKWKLDWREERLRAS